MSYTGRACARSGVSVQTGGSVSKAFGLEVLVVTGVAVRGVEVIQEGPLLHAAPAPVAFPHSTSEASLVPRLVHGQHLFHLVHALVAHRTLRGRLGNEFRHCCVLRYVNNKDFTLVRVSLTDEAVIKDDG